MAEVPEVSPAILVRKVNKESKRFPRKKQSQQAPHAYAETVSEQGQPDDEAGSTSAEHIDSYV